MHASAMVEIKSKLKASKPSIGSWLHSASPTVAEVMADSGFEWIVLDLEHGFFNIETIVNIFRAIENRGCQPIARVSSLRPSEIKLCLDAGATGIICPMINSKEDAKKLVQSVFYPPDGNRGVGLSRAQGYGAKLADYVKRHQEDTLIVAQIEHIEAINNLEAILDVPGIDAYMIGPYDLSASIGYPGDLDHPKVKEALSRFESVMKQRKKSLGFHIVSPEASLASAKIKLGYSFIAYGIDFLYLAGATTASLRELKNMAK